MKTSFPLLIASAAFVFTAGTISLVAGPGSDYWRRHGAPAPDTPASVALNSTSPKCTDATSVPVYAFRQNFSNGRGTIRQVQVGTKEVCTTCGNKTTVMKSTWPNRKGPLQPVTVAATHDCTSGCTK